MSVPPESNQDLEVDCVIASSENLMEKIAHFIDDASLNYTDNLTDHDHCFLLIEELGRSLKALEDMQLSYQLKLKNIDARVQGISGYAQTLALTSFAMRGDLTHVE